MKIGMLVQDMGVSGGYHKLVIRLAQQLTELGHDVTTYTAYLDAKQCYPEMISSIRIVSLPESSVDIFNVFKTDLVKEAKASLKFETIRAGRQLAKLIDPNLDMLIIHNTSNLLQLNFYHPKNPNFKCVWMFNCELPDDFGQVGPSVRALFPKGLGRKGKLLRALSIPALGAEAFLLRRGARYVDVCATYDSYNQKKVERALHKPTVNVYAGADLEVYSNIKPTRPTGQAPFEVLSVGVLFPYRRYEDLIEAVAILNSRGKQVNVTIVGSKKFAPQYHAELIDRIKKLKLDTQIQIKDYLPTDELHQLYARANAFVFVNDGLTWGISVFEAVAAHIPIIITDNIGAKDLIEDGRDGLVVQPRQPEQIADALQKYVDDPAFAKKLADTAAANTIEVVSWRGYAKRMLELQDYPVRKS